MIKQTDSRLLSPLLGNINASPLRAKVWNKGAKEKKPIQQEGKQVAPIQVSGYKVFAAPMAELVDAIDSKSISARSAGSIPARGTTAFHF